MKVIVEFDIDLATVEAELKERGVEPKQETVDGVIKEIKQMVVDIGEDSDALYDAVDTILDSQQT